MSYSRSAFSIFDHSTALSQSDLCRVRFMVSTFLIGISVLETYCCAILNVVACLPSSGAGSPYFDDVAFGFLISNSFTTCFTFGTEEATFSARARWVFELTSPVSVTTPFLTSNFTAF